MKMINLMIDKEVNLNKIYGQKRVKNWHEKYPKLINSEDVIQWLKVKIFQFKTKE